LADLPSLHLSYIEILPSSNLESLPPILLLFKVNCRLGTFKLLHCPRVSYINDLLSSQARIVHIVIGLVILYEVCVYSSSYGTLGQQLNATPLSPNLE
jgi:hypothetical protein